MKADGNRGHDNRKPYRERPHNNEAEESVLGGLYLDNKKIEAVEDILPDGRYFYNRVYGAIYEAMLFLSHKGIAIDLVTLQDKLKEMDVLPEVISYEFLRDLVMAVPTSVNVRDYATLVMEKAVLRELIDVTEKIASDCYECKEDLGELLSEAEKKFFAVVQKRKVGDIEPIGQIVMEALEQIDKAARTTGEVTGLATGFTDLDYMTSGFQKGNLVLVAARPAMGKTSLVLSMAHHIAIRQKKTVLMFSLEMSNVELVNRVLSMDSFVDSKKFKNGQLSDGDWESLVESSANIARSKLLLYDKATRLDEIRSISRKMKIEKDISVIIIDYLQLMSSNSRKADNRQSEIAEISRGLKILAKELEIPIIALSQLSRDPEKRVDHHPQLSDLRESGSIEQDADTVLFIYREEAYNSATDKKNIAELIIAKQRSGPTGTVELAWLPEYTQYKNLKR